MSPNQFQLIDDNNLFPLTKIMVKVFLVFFAFVAITFAYPLASPPSIEPTDDFLTRRNRRDVYGDLQRGPGGVDGTLGGSGQLYSNGDHTVIGNGQVTREFRPNGLTTFGGGVEYKGPNSGVSLNADHNRVFGTNVGVTARHDFISTKNTQFGVNAGYQQSFGGVFGNSRPNYNFGLGFTHRF